MIDLAIDSRIFITTKLEAALQELDLLFNTTNTELIGYPSFGTNFEQFLWQMVPSSDNLKSYIYQKINETKYLSTLATNVKVDILEGEFRQIYYVQITVSDGLQAEQRRYQFR